MIFKLSWDFYERLYYLSKWLRFTRFNQKRIARGIKKRGLDRLNMGSGNKGFEGWLNITLNLNCLNILGKFKKDKNVVYFYYDLNEKFPIFKNSIKYIYSSHFIEHLTLDQGIKFLKRCFKIMKKGGVIRLICPDLFLYAKNYVNRDNSYYNYVKKNTRCHYNPAKTLGEIFISKIYNYKPGRSNDHKWYYDFESLKHILELAGFKEIKRKSLWDSGIPEIKNIESTEFDYENLYVEAKNKL